MQEKWDDIDNLIFNSKEDIEPSPDYNERLMNKIHNIKCESESKVHSSSNRVSLLFNFKTNNSTALSLIMAGLMMLIVVNTGLKYKIVETKCFIKSKTMLIESKYNYNLDIINDKNLFKE
ncbi:hypothetical protein OW763_14045 [Clostridium aestuarii]|uniref:Uncharacterized protein n=1 Tax=Clostridium aestuarii TaxID=338193 RepID=A0ABT4D2I8_9CLOT|nr:hypothetical protein [Clostridium aestuarii]MCY6485451.1 hypothetical protein [Clostridium aestuarii]